MIPSLFGGRKALVDRLATSTWANTEERDVLCLELKKTARPAEVLSLLAHGDPAVRGVAGDILAASADSAVALALVEQSADKPAHVKAYMLRTFSRTGETVQKSAIEHCLADKNTLKVRAGWDAVLAMAGPGRFAYFERALREGPLGARLPAAQRLVAERSAVENVEVAFVLASDKDARMSQLGMEVLAKVEDGRVMPLMLDRFQHGDPVARQAAAAWLKSSGTRDPKALRRAMLEALGAGEDGVRRQAAEVLFTLGDRRETLLAVLEHVRGLVGWLRTRVLETLKTLGDVVLAPAIDLLAHPDEEVRTAALSLAEQLRDPRVVEPVVRLLQEKDWWMRISACDTLGRLGDERAVPGLVAALDDADTRWAAIDALSQIGSPQALRPLANLLRDGRVEVRLEVLRALSKFNDARILPLLQQLREKDPSSEVRTRATEVARDMAEKLGQAQAPTDVAAVGPAATGLRPLDRLLAMVREKGASDVHISVGEPPMVRFAGKLERMEGMSALNADQTRDAIHSILDERQRKALEATGEIDFCHAITEVGRYRANAFVQRKGLCANFRVIPNVPPTFGDLRLPPQLAELLDYHQGMIVISGPAGAGKSTTLAAIVNLINESKADHVITLEDPIEFAHPVKNALINQREVGRHTQSFARALRAALREDPDVIIVGEMRDVETVRLALTAAETGHLVVGTLHTTGAVATIERLIKSFPPDEQPQVRMGLSESLKYVVSQQLMPRMDGKGRVAVFEVLKGTLSVANMIRDNKSYQVPSLMQTGKRYGMQTRDAGLMELVEAKLIAPETAWARADKPDVFEPLCDPMKIRPVIAAPAEGA